MSRIGINKCKCGYISPASCATLCRCCNSNMNKGELYIKELGGYNIPTFKFIIN